MRQQRKTTDRRRIRRGAPGQPTPIGWRVTAIDGVTCRLETEESLSGVVIRPPVVIEVDGIRYASENSVWDGTGLELFFADAPPSAGEMFFVPTPVSFQDRFGRQMSPGPVEYGAAPAPGTYDWANTATSPTSVRLAVTGAPLVMVNEWQSGWGTQGWVFTGSIPSLDRVDRIAGNEWEYFFLDDITLPIDVSYVRGEFAVFDSEGGQPIVKTITIPI